MIEGRQFAARQSQGERSYQEDNWGYYNELGDENDSPYGLLVVLADGMGGHKGGAYASATAIDAFIEVYRTSAADIRERLHQGLDHGNELIGKDGSANADLEGMGCTLVAVDFSQDGMRWISVGDSPLWLLRDGRLQRLNSDHSMAPILQKQVETGEITAEEAASHPQRNALRSALIGEEIGLIDDTAEPMPLKPGDYVLLASDGVETLSDAEIEAIAKEARKADAETLAGRLQRNIK